MATEGIALQHVADIFSEARFESFRRSLVHLVHSMTPFEQCAGEPVGQDSAPQAQIPSRRELQQDVNHSLGEPVQQMKAPLHHNVATHQRSSLAP
eukprot:5989737-Amphidinium_carterae.2